MIVRTGWVKRLVRAALVSGAAFIAVGCGPCGEVKRIGLAGEPKAQIGHDRAMLGRYWDRYDGAWIVRIEPYEMMRHRETADAFVRLGYLRRDGKTYAFTAKARAVANRRSPDYYDFPLEFSEHRSVPPFLAAYETVFCDETHDFNRIYTFNEYLGPLTPFGKTLLAHKLLYIGHDDHSELDGRSGSWEHPWLGVREPVYRIWYFGPTVETAGSVSGERLGLKWYAAPE